MSSSNGASGCALANDPGGPWEAPFFCEPDAGTRAFLPMNDFSFSSRGCPALDPNGSSRVGGCFVDAPCVGSSPKMKDFFGPGAHGPALWVTRPDLAPSVSRASATV